MYQKNNCQKFHVAEFDVSEKWGNRKVSVRINMYQKNICQKFHVAEFDVSEKWGNRKASVRINMYRKNICQKFHLAESFSKEIILAPKMKVDCYYC